MALELCEYLFSDLKGSSVRKGTSISVLVLWSQDSAFWGAHQ